MPEIEVPGLLKRVGFRRLLVGQAVSSFGDWMATVALMALVLDLTGSPTAVGGILALRLMPSIFAAPLATTAAMRWDRRRIMLAMDAVRAVLVVLIPLVEALWWIYTLAFVTEVANLVFLPARDAAIPDLVDDDRLPAANGLVLVSSYGNIPVGAAAFGAITALPAVAGFGFVARHPYATVFVLDALTYLVSFWFISRIRLEGAADEVDEGTDASGWDAFVGMFRIPLLRAVLPGLSTVMLGAGALFSLGIAYVEEVLGATQAEFGWLIAIFGVGAALAVGWVQRRDEHVTLDLIRGGVAGMGIVLAAMSLVSNLYAGYAVAILFGAAASVALVGGISFLQERLSGRERVLGFTAFHVVLRFGMSVAAVGAGFAAERVPALTWPLVGRIQPVSAVMFAAGIFVLLGAGLIRPVPVMSATEGVS